jgi:hypothetical protein
MRSAKVENEIVFLSLKDQPQITSTAAFHKGSDPSEPDTCVKMGVPKRRTCGLHRQQYFLSASWRDALKETRRRQ